ncbi:hypothetical protein ONR75_18325 [Rhodopseudomonas sp. P2A-2r]|uniref:hypothetical protein n=1 Tax=Rhodopseudomonas sp. P2A-2r TaxID=2991972 RepID=UPI002233ECE8|nr:hypothetical protein [Rhodopseudomonas sp. P2A-2r]UZE46965.1 hypothetical protein ONR75_18325 [Rhodopseudomonas sp. P2A-2r]
MQMRFSWSAYCSIEVLIADAKQQSAPKMAASSQWFNELSKGVSFRSAATTAQSIVAIQSSGTKLLTKSTPVKDANPKRIAKRSTKRAPTLVTLEDALDIITATVSMLAELQISPGRLRFDWTA